ncbi:hypothetical protein [Cystobacter fuscus]|uniref:hypothetical protein n=1 Tax=Cystobacter fuscus TaxID=43 RepID=UPI002B2A42EC|nr:hypothetical protein F0U63_18295 [Cystobacter fuscus]
MRHLDGLRMGDGVLRRDLAPRRFMTSAIPVSRSPACSSPLAPLTACSTLLGMEPSMNLEAFRFERFSHAEGTRRRANTSGPANSQES